ncbi:MAG: hypothetical protein M3256_09885 [Actinomycetota bacterium]|nr:hypothetical protein [Actinomycetota bacterium]
MILVLLALLGCALALLVWTVCIAIRPRPQPRPATRTTLAARQGLSSQPSADGERARVDAAFTKFEQASATIEESVHHVERALDDWNATLAGAAETLQASGVLEGVAVSIGAAAAVEFADRRVAKPMASVSLNMIVKAPRLASTRPVASGRQTFGFSAKHAVTFFVPTLPRDPSLTWRRAVTAEDVLATRSVIQALLDSWPQVEARTVIVEPESEWLPEAGNLCAICRENRNPVTTALLEHVRQVTGRPIGFIPVKEDRWGNPIEWGVSLGDEHGVTVSKSFAQETSLMTRGALLDEFVELEDVAMVARFSNPWDVESGAKALVVAGVRAFGTWGAAEYLRTQIDELYNFVGDDDFACLLQVRRKYRLGKVDMGHLLALPTDDGTPTVDFVRHVPLRLSG